MVLILCTVSLRVEAKVSPVQRMSELALIQISLLIKHSCAAALRLRWTALPQPVSWAMMNLLMRATAGPGALPSEVIGQQYAGYTVKGSTVKPPIMDPPTSGQPLYNGHWLWHQLKLLRN